MENMKGSRQVAMFCLLPSVLHLTTKIYFSLASLFLLISSTRRTSARVKVALFSTVAMYQPVKSICIQYLPRMKSKPDNNYIVKLDNETQLYPYSWCTPFCWNGVTICWFGDPFCCFGTTRWEIWHLGVTKSWTSSRMLILKSTRNNKVNNFQI